MLFRSDSFSNLEENFHEYAGLIYDGAFSEHISSAEKKGLTGDDIDEEKAKEIVKNFYGEDKIDNIESHGYSENAEIPSFDFNVKMKESDINATISVSKKGGLVIFANCNRAVSAETLTLERADEIAKEFLNNHGYSNMKESYYLKQNGIVTINYAYTQTNSNNETVTIYPDLMIRIKFSKDVDVHYMAYIFNSFIGRLYFKYSTKGKNQTMVKVSPYELSEFLVPLPDIEKQKEIVKKINKEVETQQTLRKEMNQYRAQIDKLVTKSFSCKIAKSCKYKK